MEFIENTFISENELDLETANKMVEELAIITNSYNSLTDKYDSINGKFSERKLKIIKAMAFNMRG